MEECMKDKVVLVTGSTSGIGRETVLKFASFGCKVVVMGRNEQRLASVASECEQISPFNYKPLTVKAELTNEQQLKKLVEETICSLKRIDVLVNNASIAELSASILDENFFQVYNDMFLARTRSLLQLCHLFAPYLIESKGVIINVSSTSSTRPCKNGFLLTCMMDAAIDSMTKTIALELGPKGVRANTVNVSLCRTPAFVNYGFSNEQEFLDWSKSVVCDYPLGRIGEPTDYAECIAFLASPKASYITGSNVAVDGGALLVPNPFNKESNFV